MFLKNWNLFIKRSLPILCAVIIPQLHKRSRVLGCREKCIWMLELAALPINSGNQWKTRFKFLTITPYSIAQTWERAPKQWAVMIFQAVLRELTHCFTGKCGCNFQCANFKTQFGIDMSKYFIQYIYISHTNIFSSNGLMPSGKKHLLKPV